MSSKLDYLSKYEGGGGDSIDRDGDDEGRRMTKKKKDKKKRRRRRKDDDDDDKDDDREEGWETDRGMAGKSSSSSSIAAAATVVRDMDDIRAFLTGDRDVEDDDDVPVVQAADLGRATAQSRGVDRGGGRGEFAPVAPPYGLFKSGGAGGGQTIQMPSRCASSSSSRGGGTRSRTALKPSFCTSASGSPRYSSTRGKNGLPPTCNVWPLISTGVAVGPGVATSASARLTGVNSGRPACGLASVLVVFLWLSALTPIVL